MIFNRQKKMALDEPALTAFLARILKELKLEGIEVAVAFVTDSEIAKWNKKYRGKSGPTDVLSFPALTRRNLAHFKKKAAKRKAGAIGKASAETGFLGDIAIAPETAKRNAAENGRTVASELRVLTLHGVLHLMGYDHETDSGQMNRIEQQLRRRLGIE
jgi:probable rRNA maturation factor